jgi:hypothetical protein
LLSPYETALESVTGTMLVPQTCDGGAAAMGWDDPHTPRWFSNAANRLFGAKRL